MIDLKKKKEDVANIFKTIWSYPNAFSLICVVLSSIVMFTGNDGWGWLLFVAWVFKD